MAGGQQRQAAAATGQQPDGKRQSRARSQRRRGDERVRARGQAGGARGDCNWARLDLACLPLCSSLGERVRLCVRLGRRGRVKRVCA
jgi:hypothetical protein